MKLVTTSVRLPKDIIDEIEKFSKDEGIDKGTFVRKLIAESLREYRIKKALELYRERKISLWKAAEIAGITYSEALEELKRRNIPFKYDLQDLEADLYWAMK
ncbi:UPF0175 family protein [Geoglobus acetivorans]|uniref:UPF0175 family protein n=1 Tax=Geoglobus acetivorans TaxID=565033 RepID=A0ABZ3H386_GEOAI|nr:UPF0175 family protein [Geoglobus acetivorans]